MDEINTAADSAPAPAPRMRNSEFVNPHSRANRVGRLVWQIVWMFLFRPTPWFLGAWRSFLLRIFGARIGFARFHSSARIWAPWLLEAGDDTYIDANVNLYNAYGIRLGNRVIISQGSFLCSATHDYTDPKFALMGGEICILDDTWIAAEAFIAPGVRVGPGVVVGARAVVIKEPPAWTVVAGNPAKVIKERKIRG